ncbi:hypothetical protein PMAYCL1PPCAC_30729 [Pristionchus mayeri]|uniref:ZP domain-containing protein n=1 Tax=Pristionchus mayeri TaxID=1317129 RepID=A0AAN5DEV8_9BILA|nr:hypothetical protein PMAYCL1PPCAC_30729 [Pristionchus mayeri]
MLLFLLLSSLVSSTPAIADVRILGQPSLTCTSRYAVISFETSEPFQGRVSVLHTNDSACISEFSYNLSDNATVFIDLDRCTQSHFANNGSRIMQAHVDISFHPLAVTNFDRVFHLQCIDNSFVTSSSASLDGNVPVAKCSHSTRPASRWESSTFFRLGDSVVHEWNCIFDRKEHTKYHTFLTSCNAISKNGEVIHLVDENGCIVDPELLGELVYNNYTSRIYGRSRMFRFASGEMYRIECRMQLCLKASTCGPRSTPPRCAFTKEDFERRYNPKAARNGENNFNPGTGEEGRGANGLPPQILLSDGDPFDHNIVVSSDWMTVYHNHFTDVDQITEKYYLSTELNRTMVVVPPSNQKHFLLGLSSKDGLQGAEDRLVEEALRLANITNSVSTVPSLFSTNQLPQTTVSATIPMTVFTDIGHGTTIPVAESFTPPTIITSSHQPLVTATTFLLETPLLVEKTLQPSGIANLKPTDPGFFVPSSSFPPIIPEFSTVEPPTLLQITRNGLEEAPLITEPPGIRIDGANRVIPRPPPIHKHVDLPGAESKRTFHSKNRDWRLDDGSFNDTDTTPSNVTCGNATLLAAEIGSVCRWSGFEHLLLIWSIFSLAGWICLAVFVVYRFQFHRPEWVEFRPQDSLSRPPPTCSRPEIPWAHPDAFEHRLRHAYRPSVHSSREAVFRN